MGQNDLMGTAEDFADQVRPAGSAGPSPGPPARSLLPRPPSAPSPGFPPGPRPARLHPPGPAPRPRPPPEPAPGPQGRPEAWAVPSLPMPPEGSRPLPQAGPSLLGSPPVPAGGTPKPAPNPASGPSLPSRRPPTRALGVFPGPCFGAQLGGPVLPSPARAILEAEGCQRLPPRLRRRGPRPRGAWGASSAFYTVGWSLHAFPFTGRSSGAGWGADPERGLVRLEAWGPPRGKGAPWYAPCCRKPQYLFSLSQMCWVPGVPLTLPCVFLPCLDSALRLK